MAAGVALAAGAPPLQAMRWAAADTDPVALFASTPTECLRTPTDPAKARSVEIGRAAFRTPLLLGGQAARAGLSCEGCHQGGRGNPAFLFPGASGAPGTADVTLSLFSSRRGNGVHDPRPIPDLSGPRAALKVPPADLPGFIRGLVVEEFDGAEPAPAVLQGLVDYVAALDPAACPASPREPVTAGTLLADARRAVRVASGADPVTAVLMLGAARSRLRLIDERFAGLTGVQAKLAKADDGLAALQAARRAHANPIDGQAARWLKSSIPLERQLARVEARSLFNPERLAAGSNRRLLRKPS
jgi:hypothetical protein